MLDKKQKAQASALLDELLDLPARERRPRLATLTVEDAAVLAEVASLIDAAASVGDFLASPARITLPEAPPEVAVGQRLGAWRITGRIGQGGMGDVYEAARAQTDFDQRVAIKVLRLEASGQFERFAIERRILARMEHPGIARLLDGGTTADGRPFMVMEYIEGRPIVEWCNLARASLSRRLELFVQVCDAVACAHSHLIVHRDLKSSNILVSATGQVKLLDFGIAKLLDPDEVSVTQAAHVPLTPISASPEQLLGKVVTTATDTYALGLLLFELLTGAHPWMGQGAPIVQALRTVLRQGLPRASERAQERTLSGESVPVPPNTIRGDLDAIVAKAVRDEPALRYVTVAALALDIERYQRGAAVEARAGARLYVLGRALRRYRWAVAAAAILGVSLVAGFAMAERQERQTVLQRDVARRDAAREEAVRYSLTRMFRAALVDQGDQPATAKAMIDNSAQRVLREYRDQPKLAGQLVLTLADLYGALEDVEGTGKLLEGFLAESGGADQAIVADARQKLANIELLRGNIPLAAQLLHDSESFWASVPGEYREERLEGLGIRAKLQRAQGDTAGAIDTSRRAIDERVALSGRNDRETAVLYNSLAITLMAANRLEEALQAYRNTVEIYRAVGMSDELDTQIVLANIGTLELRTGRLDEAEAQLKTSIDKERSLAGDSAAVAAAMGYYGRVLSIRNRNVEALKALERAVDLGARYAGTASPVTLQNRLFLGEAQLLSGDAKVANSTLTGARQAAQERYGEDHILCLRARLALTAVAVAVGRVGDARQELGVLLPKLRAAGKTAFTYTAQAIEKLGTLQLEAGEVAAALASLQEAVAMRESTGVQDWELGKARERLGEALAASGSNAASSATLRRAKELLELQLGAEHPEVIRVRNALAKL